MKLVGFELNESDKKKNQGPDEKEDPTAEDRKFGCNETNNGPLM